MHTLHLRGAILLVLVAAIKPACGGGGGDSNPVAVVVNAVLRASQVVPRNGSAATGTATLTVSADRQSIDWLITYTGITQIDITYAYVYAGIPGENGTIQILTLVNGSFASGATGTATVAQFSQSPSDGITTFSQAVQAILNGDAYLVITTTGFGAGEIRGQLGAAFLRAVAFSGTQQDPDIATSATGSATVEFDSTQAQIKVKINHSGLTNVSAAHFHFGAFGTNGPVIVNLFAGGSFPNGYTYTATLTDFDDQPGTIDTFADAVNAILSGDTYINIHTAAYVGGEIRGQVGPARLTASLDGAQEVPTVTTGGTGTGDVTLNAVQDSIRLNLTFSGMTGTFSVAHIHTGAAGAEGPSVITLASAPPAVTSPVVGTFAVLSSLVDAMMSENSYINIHTTAEADGEIRGQLLAP